MGYLIILPVHRSHSQLSPMSLRTVTSLRSFLPSTSLSSRLASRPLQAPSRVARLRVNNPHSFRCYSSATQPRDYEAELSNVLDEARRNVAKGKRAPVGDDNCVRMAAFGKPGSGKGTLSGRLVKNYDIRFISTGDVLRHEIAAKSEVGRKVEKVVAAGGLVPDELMLELVQIELDRHRGESWILDGFPRTLKQGKMLSKLLTDQGRPLNLIVNLNVPDAVIMSRIIVRWVHLPSGRVYNDDFNPPKVKGVDDVTGEPLTKRPDDVPEVFAKRLASYYEATAPLLEYFADEYPDVLHSLTGNTSDELWPMLQAVVEPPLHGRNPPLKAEQATKIIGEADDLRDSSEVPVGDRVAHLK